jgi:hypothetical protein
MPRADNEKKVDPKCRERVSSFVVPVDAAFPDQETTMKFLTFYHPENPSPPTAERMAEMGQFMEEMVKAGILVETGGVQTSGTRVRLSGKKFTVTDGPFAESKEVIVGWALLEARDKAHVLEVAKRFLELAGDGESEIRQVMSEPPKVVG